MATLEQPEQREEFVHDQLDTTQQSIRVISINPELSPEGWVQCSIRQTTIDAEYNCLSYRWGSLDFSHTLIVDGKRLSINQSLHDFLARVRTFTYREPDQLHANLHAKYHLRDNLWIDAICIDQNSESEKNHQVAQMGKIYSDATKVVMWLGNIRNSPDVFPKTTMREYAGFICLNEYWTRAWVAQEVILAKDPVLMIDDHLISLPDLLKEIHELRFQYVVVGKNIIGAWEKFRPSAGFNRKPRITQWLDKLLNVECALIHDRIFSLLEMAEEGGRILVDYNMPPAELVYHVLNVRDDEVCLCEVFLLNHALKIQNEATNTLDPCVYVQWKTDRSNRDYHHATSELEEKFWSNHEKMTNDDQIVVRAPLRKVIHASGFVRLCSEASAGKARVPVQLGHGHVHDWQIVSEDGKVEILQANFAEVL